MLESLEDVIRKIGCTIAWENLPETRVTINPDEANNISKINSDEGNNTETSVTILSFMAR